MIYIPSLSAPLFFDDQRNLFNDNLMLTELSIPALHKTATNGALSSRPVANISFALNYYFHKDNLTGYHLVNIIIHIINGFLLFVISRRMLRIPALSDKYRNPFIIALSIAFLWAVHPLHTQSVSYLVQRMNSMATMFFLTGFLSYLFWRQSGKKWIYTFGVLISFLLALGSKEIAATFPVILIVFDWYFFQDLKSASKTKLSLFLIPTLAAFTLFSFFYLGSDPFTSIPASFINRDFSLSQRLLTESRIVIFYISLLLFPHPSRLNLLHEFPISTSFFNPVSTLFSILLITGIIILAVILAKRERLISFCLLWFVINLLIESTIFPLELIFEHRTYLPSIMIIFLFVCLIFRFVKKKQFIALVIGIAICLNGYWTYKRNIVWSDDVIFWQDCLKKSPNSARVHNNLGFALKNKGEFTEAIKYFTEALRIQPDLALASYNLRMVQAFQESPDNAIRLYRDATRINPHNAGAFFNLGVLLAQQGDDNGAIDNYKAAIRVRPSFAEAHNNLGSALNRRGDMEGALSEYREAARYNPTDAIAQYNVGLILVRKREYGAAAMYLSEAVRLKPDFSLASKDLEKVQKLLQDR